MLSRVIKDPAIEARPVALRTDVSPAAKAAAQKGAKLTEAETLRLRIAEVQQLGEQKARLAYEEGRRAGEAAAQQAAEARVKEQVDRLAKTIREIAGVRPDCIYRAEADTVRLTLAIVRRVLHRQVIINPDILSDLIHAALHKLQAQEVYRVRVHPDHEDVMKRCLEERGRGQTVTIVPDPTQSVGGAVFETGRGLLDASLETQIDEIARVVAEQLEARS